MTTTIAFDPKRLTDDQMRTIFSAQHRHADDLRIVDLATHQQGYFPAQAAGFALISLLDEHMDMLADMPQYVEDHRGDVTDNGRWFDIEDEAKAHAMTAGSIHALRIVRAQGRDNAVARMLERGVVMLRLWNRMTPGTWREEFDRRENERYADLHDVFL